MAQQGAEERGRGRSPEAASAAAMGALLQEPESDPDVEGPRPEPAPAEALRGRVEDEFDYLCLLARTEAAGQLAAEASCVPGVERREAREGDWRLEEARGEIAELRERLHLALWLSGSGRAALENARLRAAAQDLSPEVAAWRARAEAGVSAEARLEAVGWLDEEARSELSCLRRQARELRCELGRCEGLAEARRCGGRGSRGGSEVRSLRDPRPAPTWDGQLGEELCCGMRMSLSAVQGLQAHAGDLRDLFAHGEAPTRQLVQRTWRYVRGLERANHQFAELRSSQGAPQAIQGSAWAAILASAERAEGRVRGLALRLQALQRGPPG